MHWLHELISRLTSFLRRRRDEDLDQELESHLQLAIEENMRRGMTREQARIAACRVFGGVTQIKESYRMQRGLPFFTRFGQDLRYAMRRLRSSPGFTLVAILTLALGIGANTAIFTLIQGMLLRSLPVADPARLYRIGDRDTCCYFGNFESPDGDFDLFSYDLYQRFRQSAPEFEQLAAVQAGGSGYSVQYGAMAPRPMRMEFVSGNYFTTLGVRTYAGRPFADSDDHPGAPPVVVLSYAAWETEFGRDPAIVGATIYVQRHPFVVSGIAPPGFYGDRIAPISPDMWMPISTEIEIEGANAAASQHVTAWLYAIGRLRPGVSTSALEAKLSAVLRQWMLQWPAFNAHGSADSIPRQHVVLARAGGGIQKLQKETGENLSILMILSSVVLLISCANIASLLLARATAQRTQVAIRMALGAARRRIVRQILTECLLLSIAGGVAGLGVAWFGAHVILALAYPEARNMPLDAYTSWPVLGFTFLVSLLTGVIFGMAPAWASSHAQPAEALRGANVASRDRSSLRQRSLVILQLAMSVVLLSCTFLLTRSLMNLEHQNFGIQTTHRYTFQIDPEGAGYTSDTVSSLYRQMEDRLGALPGVVNVSFARYIPLGGNEWGTCIFVQGQPDPGPRDGKCFADWVRVSRQFLDSLGVPIVRGRGFSAHDTATSPLVAIVNQAFGNHYFPGQDPIGKHIGKEEFQYAGTYEIVGVCSDFVLTNPRDVPHPILLLASAQPFNGYQTAADIGGEKASMFLNSVILNVSGSAPDPEMSIRKAVAEIDPGLPMFRFVSYDSVVAGNFNQERLVARLTSGFGVLALILASVGLYGVMSYFVARRTSEIGIRMAIGASRSLIIRLVLRGAVAQLILGLALGVPASMFLGRLMASLLFHVSGYAPWALAGASAVLALCAAIAALVPALRAASLDPVRALRIE